MELPGFSEIIGTSSYDGGPTNVNEHLYWTTTNRFMISTSPFNNPAVMGIKTAYHPELGSYAVSMAKRDGYSYLAVLLACNATDNERQITPLTAVFDETNRLYTWAFETFKVKTLLERGRASAKCL
jgi:D-alanyl-D-alanine carboxypeptidase